MKSPIIICAFVFFTGLAYAGQKSDPWLSIIKSEDGFLFKGHLERSGFTFDIPGDQINVFEQEDLGDPARTSIDDIFFAVMHVNRSDFPSTSPDILISYRNNEQKQQKEQFGRVTFSDLDVCKGATLNHQSWELETLDIKAPPQVYMAVKVGNGVIVISSAFANSSEKLAMLSKFQVFANLSR